MRTPGRTVLLAPAGIALLAGIDAGLLRLGIAAPVSAQHLPEVHGPLMVLGVLGTLIALERAVALRSPLGYAAPALLGAGALVLAAGLPLTVGQVLLLDGTVALVLVLTALWRRRRDDEVLVQVLGALLAAIAALLWVRLEASVVVPLLVGFVVLTILAERVELARLHLSASAGRVLVTLAILLAGSTVGTLLAPAAGTVAVGASLLALVGWLAPRDVARRTIHGTGLPRFAAAAMLAGYAWLGAAGLAWVAAGVLPASGHGLHDVVVHAVFLGFTMSMVLAHAPVILPAVIRLPMPYRPALWVPLAALHGGLAVRVAGDLAGSTTVTAVGGYATAAALVLLPLTVLLTVRAGRVPSAAPAPAPTRPRHLVRSRPMEP
ncbi:hypothetical protein ACK8HX_07975 [Oryzobacter sp. R7]|uniref:hypothetical protein n=1 Tax=Oryzobacter faecalis TaxID=3388656 RepID=UPI00398D33BB